MPDSTRRALRTLVQVVLGQIAAGALTEIWNNFISSHHVDSTISMAMGVILTVLVTYAQNELEDRGAIPAVGKAMASSGADPVTVSPAK